VEELGDMNKKLVKTVEIPIPGLAKPVKVPDIIGLAILGIVLIILDWGAFLRFIGWLLLIIAAAIVIIRYFRQSAPPPPPPIA